MHGLVPASGDCPSSNHFCPRNLVRASAHHQFHLLGSLSGPSLLVELVPPCQGTWHHLPPQDQASIPPHHTHSGCCELYVPTHLPSLPTKDRLARTALPPMRNGTRDRRHQCVGCHRGLSNDSGALRCHFSDSGFRFKNGRMARLCQSAYHTCCFSVGAPFVSCRKNEAGLCFPDVTKWGTFICEACTVRSVSDCELVDVCNGELLALECMSL
jgi:hypothetical protein